MTTINIKILISFTNKKTPQCTILNLITLHNITPHHTTPHNTTSYHTTPHNTTPLTKLHNITPHYITPHNLTLVLIAFALRLMPPNNCCWPLMKYWCINSVSSFNNFILPESTLDTLWNPSEKNRGTLCGCTVALANLWGYCQWSTLNNFVM